MTPLEDVEDSTAKQTSIVSQAALVAGPLAAAALIGAFYRFDLAPGQPRVGLAAGVALLMAVWWICEAVPLAVTALLPVVLFPTLGVMDGKAVAAQYFNDVIFLFIGGFMVALAMQRWNLHRRIALSILLLFGGGPRRILLGFMVATALLSSLISNTATAMMLVAIALAIITQLESTFGQKHVHRFAIALLLGVAYGASVGGIATLVGTPPNLAFVGIFKDQFPSGPDISFAQWSAFAVPISVAMLVLVWAVLAARYLHGGPPLTIERRMLQDELAKLGPMSAAEWIVLVDFVLLVLLWVSREDIPIGEVVIPGWQRLFSNPKYLNDGTVAVALALVLFIAPAGRDWSRRVLDWATAVKLPWGIVLLFGGGFALAKGFGESGLSAWLGGQLHAAERLNPWLLVVIVCLCLTFMTELTSNTATTQMILPVLASLAVAIKVNPLLLMVPATISCSCAFMMPVATPPNAIVFGSSRLRIADMASTGLILNFIGVVVVVLAVYLLGGAVLGIDVGQMPDWAVAPRP